jgi:hypothetical protein
MYEVLTAPRGINKYMLLALVARTGEAVARIEKALDRIERREGPPTNGTAPAELTRDWLQMVEELLADEETPRKTLGVIIARKRKELS